MAKKVGVILSGCGVYDGSEIHEAVITLLALDRAGVEIICLAPDIPQMHVINHQTGEVSEGETRNVMVESARIARGPVRDVTKVTAAEIDALVLPGGFGAAKNLCNFAIAGAECEIDPGVKKLIQDVHAAGKPIVAECIAPVVTTKALTEIGIKPKITIGGDAETAEALEKMGGIHEKQPVMGVSFDPAHKLLTTPAYMLGPSIKDVALGIENTIAELMKLI